jgi:hypothetical protein
LDGLAVIYEYKCPECDQRYLTEFRGDRLNLWQVNFSAALKHDRACDYNGEMLRVFSFSVVPMLQEHWNASLNKPITSDRHFREELKRASEEAFLYDGFDHDYQPVDSEDTKSLGVTAEGLDHTNRARVAEGKKPINLDVL